MSKSKKPRTLVALDAIVLVSELGLAVSVPIVIAVVAGKYLDAYLGGQGLVLMLSIMLGIVFGIYSGYKLLRKVMGNSL